MKKLLVLAFITVMMLLLVACDSQNISVDIDMNPQDTSLQINVSTESSDTVDENLDTAETNVETINYELEEFITPYSDGVMFAKVTIAEEENVIACIDKSGQIVFTLDDSYTVRCSFHNGLAVLSTTTQYVLCDKTGKIITPEEIGATSFAFGDEHSGEQEAFLDGYVLALRTKTSFEGSVTELAVLNSKLEKIVDYSKDLYKFYYDTLASYGKISTYYSGYLFNNNQASMRQSQGYINLNTGEYSENISELFSKISLNNKSDLWIADTGWGQLRFYNVLEDHDKTILDLTEYTGVDGRQISIISLNKVGGYDSTTSTSFGYVDGAVGLIFEVDDVEVVKRNYFTMLDENGEFYFAPVEVSYWAKTPKYDGGTYLFCTFVDDSTIFVQVFDKTGEIARKEFVTEYRWNDYMSEFGIGDGVVSLDFGIIIESESYTHKYLSERYILDLNLEPLYE